jgi:hypothetical protein
MQVMDAHCLPLQRRPLLALWLVVVFANHPVAGGAGGAGGAGVAAPTVSLSIHGCRCKPLTVDWTAHSELAHSWIGCCGDAGWCDVEPGCAAARQSQPRERYAGWDVCLPGASCGGGGGGGGTRPMASDDHVATVEAWHTKVEAERKRRVKAEPTDVMTPTEDLQDQLLERGQRNALSGAQASRLDGNDEGEHTDGEDAAQAAVTAQVCARVQSPRRHGARQPFSLLWVMPGKQVGQAATARCDHHAAGFDLVYCDTAHQHGGRNCR